MAAGLSSEEHIGTRRSLRFEVWAVGFGFGVSDLGFRFVVWVLGLRFGVWVSGFRFKVLISGPGVTSWALELRVRPCAGLARPRRQKRCLGCEERDPSVV